MRCMGLDIGDKTIGIALSDPLFISAQGIGTIERIGIRKDADKVLKIAEEHEVVTIVSGLPLMLSGDDSPQTAKVREFVNMMENKARSTGLKLKFEFQDERFTTKIAESVLIEGDLSRKKRRKIIDRQAAVVILQSYLERRRNEEARNAFADKSESSE
ncbi:MAG: Holliday junction resolvase RuvX [Clostridiales bacterium]|nr:Holliday junction resolvase RuvX [Clostridiales bacterium]